MSLITELKNPLATLRWLELPEGKEFLEILASRQTGYNRSLRHISDVAELYRLQGKLEVMELIAPLSANIRKHLSDIQSGKKTPTADLKIKQQ